MLHNNNSVSFIILVGDLLVPVFHNCFEVNGTARTKRKLLCFVEAERFKHAHRIFGQNLAIEWIESGKGKLVG